MIWLYLPPIVLKVLGKDKIDQTLLSVFPAALLELGLLLFLIDNLYYLRIGIFAALLLFVYFCHVVSSLVEFEIVFGSSSICVGFVVQAKQ